MLFRSEALRVVRAFERTSFPVESDEAAGSMLVVGGQAGTGAGFNVVPGSAWFSVDRRFNRRRYDAARTVDGFARRLTFLLSIAFLSMALWLTAAAPYTVVVTGDLVSLRRGSGTRTWVYERNEPTAPYLMSVQIGRYEMVDLARGADMMLCMCWDDQEVMDAFTDFQAGRLGSIPAQRVSGPTVPHGDVQGETDQDS